MTSKVILVVTIALLIVTMGILFVSCAMPPPVSATAQTVNTPVVKAKTDIKTVEYKVTVRGVERTITQINLSSGTCFVLTYDKGEVVHILGFSCN